MSLLVQHISMPIETETNAGVVCLQREAWWTLLFRMSNVFIYFQKQEKGSIFPRNRNSLLKMDTEMKSSMMYLQPFIYPFLQMKFILGHHRMNLQWFHCFFSLVSCCSVDSLVRQCFQDGAGKKEKKYRNLHSFSLSVMILQNLK